MFDFFIDFFSYDFLIKALISGCLISLCAGLLGVVMVLKKNAMIGDGLSHVGFGALAVASACNLLPLPLAIIAVIIATLLILRLNKKHHLQGDTAIAITSVSALAIGIFALSFKKGGALNDYLFGSILAISTNELIASIILTVVMLGFFVFFYHRIFALSFDEDFAVSIGVKTSAYQTIIAILCAITIILGMQLMGALLISALIVFPCVCARQVCRTFRSVTITSAIISLGCFSVGLFLSFLIDAPVSATIVLVNLALLFILKIISWQKK